MQDNKRDKYKKWEFKQTKVSQRKKHIKGKNPIWRNLPHTSLYSLQEMSPWLQSRDAVKMFFLSLSATFCTLILKV